MPNPVLSWSTVAGTQPRSFPKEGIYLIRHGETEHTQQKRVTGAGKDIPLTAEGRASMQAVAKLLAKSEIDCFYCNSLQRSKESAEILAAPLKAEIKVIPGLMPQDMGEFAGKEVSKVGEQLKQYASDPNKPVPGGEAYAAFFDRFCDYLEDELKESKEEPIGVIGHGKHFAALPAILAHIRGEDPDLSKVPVTSNYGPGSVIWISPDAKTTKVLRKVAPEKTVS